MQRSKSRTPLRVAFGRALAKAWGMSVAILATAAVPASWTDAAAATAGAPYPPSTAIPGISFRWETYRRLAPGSDNWPLTWSADGNQYAAFGDGGGFGGTNSLGRVSLGVARIEGAASAYEGGNVWGGAGAEAGATFAGKSRGVLAVGTDLYMWRCGNGSRSAAFRFQQIYESTDNAKTWRPANWVFPGTLTFFCPAFAQYGQGYAGARDGYVYMYASERDNEVWEAHTPGRVMLMRAPVNRLMDRAAYEFFAGRDAAGGPRWSASVAAREPVFEDRNGARLPAVIYNAGLGRYLLTVEQAPKGSSNIGIFDAPEPWGPWTTVLYERGWGRGEIDTTAFYYNFSPKWWANGGRDFVLVFTGSGQLDAWNSVQGSFTTGAGTGDGDESGEEVATGTGTGTIPDAELATTAALATAATADSVASRGAVRSTAADDVVESAITDSNAGTRSARRTVRTSTTESGASSGVAGAVGAASSIPRVVQPSVAGSRSTAASTVTARATSGSSTTRRRTRVDTSSADGTPTSSQTTAGSVSATAGTRTNAVARSTGTATSESGQRARGIVTSSSRSAPSRSADGTRGTTTTTTAAAATTAANTTGSRAAGTSARATSATAPTGATPSAAGASSSATGSPAGARTGVGPAPETSSEVAGREETDIDVDAGVGASVSTPAPAPAPARSSRGAAPSVASVAEPAAVAGTPARAPGREVGRAAATGLEPASDVETTVAAADPAAADPAVADLPAPVDGRSLEPRLVGIMERGASRTALVVPSGASQPIAVRTGDRLGSWSVEGVDGQQVALRSGEQTLVLRLFAAGG